MSRSPGARQMIGLVADADSWKSWDHSITTVHDADYRSELERARERTGVDEAVITGTATVRGHHVALIVGEFGFLGGSIGVDAGRRIADAMRHATSQNLPILALPTSGGTRMQEGTTAFVQMVRITAAVQAHKAAGLLYLVYLRHPTTGGVLASWGSLGHVTLAEPGALVGFLGPRVYETMTGVAFPNGIQTSENLHEQGIVDSVISPVHIADEISAILDIVQRRHPMRCTSAARGANPMRQPSSWACVQRSRSPQRPGIRALLADARVAYSRLSGSGEADIDDAIVVALASIDGQPCVLVAQDRAATAPIGVQGLRIARRGFRLADELKLPLVTVIDTAGAELSARAESNGLAGQIARCIAELMSVSVPSVSLILGQGAGGAALALLPTDRILAAEHGWLSPLPPEGASAIVYRDTTHAAEIAEHQGIGSADLARSGLVDIVIDEGHSMDSEPQWFVHDVLNALSRELAAPVREHAARNSPRLRRFDEVAVVRPAHA